MFASQHEQNDGGDQCKAGAAETPAKKSALQHGNSAGGTPVIQTCESRSSILNNKMVKPLALAGSTRDTAFAVAALLARACVLSNSA
jgi:hypothetical protein